MSWIQRDARLLLFAKGVSTFSFAFVAILLPIYMSVLGYDSISIGLVLAASILGSAAQTLIMGIVADHIGRKKTLILLSVFMIASGIIYSSSRELISLILAALIAGAGGPGSGIPGGGPYLAVHNALIASKITDQKRNTLFAVSSAIASLGSAGGSLFISVPDLMKSSFGLTLPEAGRILLVIYALLGVVVILAILPVKEEHTEQRTALIPKKSGWLAKRLVVIGAFDGLGTGFIITPVVAYWFYLRFNVSLSSLGSLFFVFSLTTTASYFIAVRLAHKIGSVNAIFFTHLPSVLLLFLMPLAPTFELAAATMIVRPLISQIDVPLRQSYMMALSHPEERASVAGIAGVSKTAPSGVSPSLSGYAIQQISIHTPFIAGGVFQIVSDILFYFFFRKVKPPEEIRKKV
ncbi:MAG: MFS transporter [Thaumarchaeota archaeon]|nr:MFS transporter [Nitrososphaerota archaeon]